MDPIPDLSALDLRMLPDWLRDTGSSPAHPGTADEPGPARRGKAPRREDRQRTRPGSEGRGGSRQRKGLDVGENDGVREPHGRAGREARAPRRRDEPRKDDPPRPADVEVRILPEPVLVEKLASQMRDSRAAYPLMAMAYLFLSDPARHRFEIVSRDPGCPIVSAGPDSPVAFDVSLLARPAFRALQERFYRREEVAVDPPKGSFSRIARCPFSATLLGPTSFHTFQSSVRTLYERRFRHRMSFEEYRSRLELVSDPEAIEGWKQQVSRRVVYSIPAESEGADPVILGGEEEAFAHFRERILPGLICRSDRVAVPGSAVRDCPDRSLVAALRAALAAENRFPGRLAHALQAEFARHGILLWKHRKRHLFLSAIRPRPFTGDRTLLSARMQAILSHIEAHPQCTRRELAEAILGSPEQPGSVAPGPETEAGSSATVARRELATALHFLIEAGHVILFHNGTLDLALPPRGEKPPETSASSAEPPPARQPEQ